MNARFAPDQDGIGDQADNRFVAWKCVARCAASWMREQLMRYAVIRNISFAGSAALVGAAGLAYALPVLAFAAGMPSGRVEYESHCTMCHGATGSGNGWLAWFLRQPVPSLTQLKKKNGGVFPVEQVHQVIDGRKQVAVHGPRDMPVWGEVYFARAQKEPGPGHPAQVDEEIVQAKILALIDYISKLQE